MHEIILLPIRPPYYVIQKNKSEIEKIQPADERSSSSYVIDY